VRLSANLFNQADIFHLLSRGLPYGIEAEGKILYALSPRTVKLAFITCLED